MLVLTRRVGEEVVIRLPGGEVLRVKVALVEGCKVRLGFTAPQEVKIYRKEVDEERDVDRV